MDHRDSCLCGITACVGAGHAVLYGVSNEITRTCASSLYASTYDQLMKEFGCSQEVVTLGLSLFVVGIAVGPMVLSPLSEVRS